MKDSACRRKLYFAHAYGYACAVAQRLRSSAGRAELVQFIDVTSPTFRWALKRPAKRSVLHELLYDLAQADWNHEVTHWRIDSLEQFFRDHSERVPKRLRAATDGNSDKLSSRLERPIEKLADAAFYVLFGDRSALLSFNEMLASVIQDLSVLEFPELQKAGTVRRPGYIPTWLKRAVYHRDKGRCQVCHRDLTGVVSPISEAHLDHIWPLARSGCNDATNFQLLCGRCNGRKAAGAGATSEEYYVYW